MSHYMAALAMKQAGIKPATKIVLYWLADHHNGETGLCFPSLKTLERQCEMNRSTIVRHLEVLESAGLISRDKRVRDNGSQTSTSYSLHLVPVAERNSPCCKMQQPPVAKCDPLNLGILNLGIEQEELVSSLPALSSDIDEVLQAVEAYNEASTRTGWPKAQTISPARRTAVRARIKDAGGMEGWGIAISKCEASSFLTGRTDRPFTASFDFIIKQENFTKIMEGNYDDRTSAPRTADQNRGPSGYTQAGGRGPDASIASIVARRRIERGQ
jgi:hypothetical protein